VKLRGYQVEIDKKIAQSYADGNRKIMVRAPTGAGKTVMAGKIIQDTLDAGLEAAFVVPLISLIDQTVKSLYDNGITDVGVIQSFHPLSDSSKRVQVCSLDTLIKRRHMPLKHVVIIDEAHRRSKFVNEWMEKHTGVAFIGMSATPSTLGLGRHWDDLVTGPTTKDLIDMGYLCPFEVYAPSSPDLSRLKTVAGDYNKRELGSRVMQPKLVASVVSTWLERGKGRPTIAFAVNRIHAKAIQDSFTEAGVRCGYVDAYTSMADRDKLRMAMAAGHVEIVVNVGCLTMGLDWDVRCIILARPTKSEALFVQMMGRGLRTAGGKDNCLILDHSDTHKRLGFVTDIHFDALDMNGETRKVTKVERKKREPKVCTNCHQVTKLIGTWECPGCGYKPMPINRVAAIDGKLTKMTESDVDVTEVMVAFAMFKHIAAKKGYKPGWAFYKTKELTGKAPKGSPAPREPSKPLLNWLTHQNIKRARSKS
jgi:superfamily II DNA or RNA helicase